VRLPDAQLAKTEAKLAETSVKIDRVFEIDDNHLEELLYRAASKTPKTIARVFFLNLLEINPVVACESFEIIHSGFHDSRATLRKCAISSFSIKTQYSSLRSTSEYISKTLNNSSIAKVATFRYCFPNATFSANWD